MSVKHTHHRPAKSKDTLQDFIDYSVKHYEGFGPVLSRALKATPPKTRS